MKVKSVRFVLILTIFISIATNMAHPVTPVFIKENSLPAFMFGVFFATMSLGNFIFSPIWGTLSDRNGRIKYLAMGIFGYGISQLGFGFSTNPYIIVLFRFLAGMFIVSYLTVIVAYLTDISKKENRLKNFSYFAANTTIGTAIGSLLGGVIGSSNYKVTFLVQFILCTLLTIVIVVFLKESKEKNNDLNKIKIKLNSFSFKDIEREKRPIIILIMVQVTLFYFASTSYNSSINYYIEDVLSLGPTANGVYMAIAGVIGFLSNILFTSYLGRKVGEEKLFKRITIIIGGFLIIAYFVKSTGVFFIMTLMFVAGSGIYVPLQQLLITKQSKENHGQILGLQNSSKALGMIGGSLFSGYIFTFGEKLPFLFAGIVLIIGFILIQFREKKVN